MLIAKLTFIVLAEQDVLVSIIGFNQLIAWFIFILHNLFVFFISGKNGIAINLVDSEKSMEVCREIEKHFGKKIHLLDAEDSDEIEKIGS